MFHKDYHHSGMSTNITGPFNAKLDWMHKVSSPIYSSPTLGPNNTVIFGSFGGNLVCLDRNSGQVLWEFSAKATHRHRADISATATIVKRQNDLVVVVPSNNGNLYCLQFSTGKLIWKFQIPCLKFDGINSSPIVYKNNVYFGADGCEGSIFAIDLDSGKLNWSMKTYSSGVPGSPAISLKQNLLIVGDNSGNLNALDLDSGKLIWKTQLQGIVYSSPTISQDENVVFVGSNGNLLYALDLNNGTEIWSQNFPGWVDGVPCLQNGIVYASCSNSDSGTNVVMALNSTTGDVIWTFSQINQGFYTPVVDALQQVFVVGLTSDVGTNSTFYSLKDGNVVWQSDLLDSMTGPSLDDLGALYVTSIDGVLYKYKR